MAKLIEKINKHSFNCIALSDGITAGKHVRCTLEDKEINRILTLLIEEAVEALKESKGDPDNASDMDAAYEIEIQNAVLNGAMNTIKQLGRDDG